MNENGFLENYNLENCYCDTSYYDNQESSIVVSNFDNSHSQIYKINNYLVINANDGFKLDNEFSFDLYPTNSNTWYENEPLNYITITNDNFTELNSDLILDIDVNRWDFQLNGVNVNDSLVYKFNIETNKGFIFLIGGFSDSKLIFGFYTDSTFGSSEYDDYNLTQNDFYITARDVDDNPIGYLSLLENLNFSATGGAIEPDVFKNIFRTYYIDNETMQEIRDSGSITDDILINTYSYPLKFNDDDLENVNIKIGNIQEQIQTNTFKKNITNLEIFKFEIPAIPNVSKCIVRIPFDNNINLEYDEIKNKIITGYISYEVLTNTTTLFINDGEKTIYKNIISISVKLPYKPTGNLDGYNEPTTRLSVEQPLLYIKGYKKSNKTNFLKGFITNKINNILKDEIDILDDLLKNGVYINEIGD